MENDDYAASAASMLRGLAEGFETGKYQETTSVTVNFYTGGCLISSHGRHKPTRQTKENVNV